MWAGTNFLLSFWWQPDQIKMKDQDGKVVPSLRSLVYKGIYPYGKTTPLHVEADLTSGAPPYVKVTVGGQSFRSANRLHETQFSFICVAKEDRVVRLYLGVGVSILRQMFLPALLCFRACLGVRVLLEHFSSRLHPDSMACLT